MADSTIHDLTENTTPALTDLLVVDTDPAGTPVTQKLTIENLLNIIATLTTDASPASGDYLISYDVSAGTVKKVAVSSVGGGGGGGGDVLEVQVFS